MTAVAEPLRVIERKYRLLSELGSGTMGVVYLAEQLDVEGRPQRQVALKTLRSELSSDPEFTQRFLREVRVAMQLQCPHTITVYDSGRDETGALYYTMALARGPTLRELLKSAGPLPVARAVEIAAQICGALAEAHGLPDPVVHRDLKPANVFVETREGRDVVRLGDFGIAKVVSEQTAGLTRVDQSLGTPLYMAPEQWLGEPVDGRTDLYALGILTWEMLVGRVPFPPGQPLNALTFQHLQQPLPALPESVPLAVRTLVARLGAKAKSDRPADAAEARRALEHALAAETAAATDRTELLAPATRVPTSTSSPAPASAPPPRIRVTGPAARPKDPPPRSHRIRHATLGLASLAVIAVTALVTLGAPRFGTSRREPPAIPPAPIAGVSGGALAPMVAVAAGDFLMGCNERVDTGCFDNEKPGTRRTLPAFEADREEVTVAAYQRCVDAGACSKESFSASPACNWHREGRTQHPINCVSFDQATAYCTWAGKRLPTEAEWEKAARGTDGRIFPWGNEWDPTRVNIADGADGFDETAPVGSFPAGASPYGALDVAGNVFEWTTDWYAPSAQVRVLRGGSFAYGPRDVRTSNRYGDRPDTHRPDIGFRCVR